MSLARHTPLKRTPGPARKTPLRPSTRSPQRARITTAGKTHPAGDRRASGLQKPQRTRRKGWKLGIVLLAKSKAKFRDFFRCQFPGCTVAGRDHVEAAHLRSSGMGGRLSVSDQQKCYVTLCHDHHQGPRSQHQHYIDVRPRDPEAGGDGHLDWYTRTRRGNEWSGWRHAGTTAPAVTTFALRS